MYLFIFGALATQFTYILIQWFQLRYKEYLLYATYIATFILYAIILFQEDVLVFPENSDLFRIVDFFKRPLAFLLYLEYFVFAQYFIDFKNRFPTYYKILLPLKKIIVAFIVIQVGLQIMGIQYKTIGNISYYTSSIFLFTVFLVFIFKLWKSEDRLVKYVLWASLSISAGGFISNFITVTHSAGLIPRLLADYYFLPTCLGAAFEIYFLNTGIIYKVSLSEKKLIATQQELIRKLTENENLLTTQQNIRNKIAQDLHDDIGATLSGIALHSHLASKQITENKTGSVLNSLTLIANGAVEMVNNLNDVVWSVNPKNDSAGQMFDRLKEYAYNIAQTKNILIQWDVAESIENIKLSMEGRRNIFLICKEAINNAVKYADCNYITISGGQTGWLLFLTVSDNGKGFELNERLSGHGLMNMKARAEENKMKLEIESKKDQGTTIRLNYQITQ